MVRITPFTFSAAGVLLGLTSAQSQSQSALVTQIWFAGADQQPLDASIIAQSPGQTTLVMGCAPGTDSDDCGFPAPITLTVGPSTLHYSASGLNQLLGEIDCKITASATADCTLTQGLYSDSPTGTETGDEYLTPPASSTTTSALISGSDMMWLEITITAGLEKTAAAAAAAATATSTAANISSGDSSGVGGSQSGSGAATATATATSAARTSTSSATAASATGNVAAGPSKVGYTGLGIAGALVAGSMMML